MTTLVIDYDYVLFAASCVTDKSFIVIKNKINNEEMVMKSRTEFWGHHSKKAGGWLAEINQLRKEPYSIEDFLITDEREIEPIENTIQVAKSMIKGLCNGLNTKKYYGYSGTGSETFRHKKATLMPYKGQRDDLYKPVQIPQLRDYLIDYHDCELVSDIEADDAVNTDCYQGFQNWKKTRQDKDKYICVAIDKDSKAGDKWLYNPDKDKEPRIIQGLGTLFRDGLNIDGSGRMWFYYQAAYGDSSDNYLASCLSKVKHGEISAYNALKDVQTDKQAWQALVNLYKKLYPEEITFVNFRGDTLTVDWLYILKEVILMAHMRRWPDDSLNVEEILKRLEVDYES